MEQANARIRIGTCQSHGRSAARCSLPAGSGAGTDIRLALTADYPIGHRPRNHGTHRCASQIRAASVVQVAGLIGFCGTALFLSTTARAENAGILISPIIDPEYSRDRNVSVNERTHPDYDPLGLRVGTFIVHPSLSAAANITNNVYLDDGNKKSDVYGSIVPVVTIDSDWSVHRFGLIAAGDLRRYANQTLRNQNAWYVYSQGRVDVTSDANIQIDTQLDKSYESPYSGDLIQNLTVPSTFLRKMSAIRATYQPGRVRLIVAVDISSLNFSTLRFANGSTRTQSYRNRAVYRGSGVYEYAISPSISVYAQAIYDKTNYDENFIGTQPNRDSKGFNLLSGTNFDLAGLARGSIGIGYSKRQYLASYFYRSAQGLSAQVKVELFPNELTTVGLTVQRQLQDVSLSNNSAYWENRLEATADHELRDNLILSASAEAARRKYVKTTDLVNVYQFQLNGRYEASRGLGFTAGIAYGSDHPSGTSFGNPFHELRGTLGVRIRG